VSRCDDEGDILVDREEEAACRVELAREAAERAIVNAVLEAEYGFWRGQTEFHTGWCTQMRTLLARYREVVPGPDWAAVEAAPVPRVNNWTGD
jgi:hypothetical protein